MTSSNRSGSTPPRSRLRLGIVLVLFAAPGLGDQSFHLFPAHPPADDADLIEDPAPQTAAAPEPHPLISWRLQTYAITTGVLLGCANGLVRRDDPQPFHVEHERFFGKNTYAGGVDKASHFVFYNALARELAITYSRLGHSRDTALLMGAAVSLAGGLVTELSDGVNHFGFSWEDFLTDFFGAGTALAVTYYGLDDLMGFRFGKIPASVSTTCCSEGRGKDYTSEIYTGDLKLAGAARRLHFQPGLFRYFLISMTYNAKGYRFSQAEFRQRNIGGEIGINFPEILTELHVPDTKWWGRALFIFFNFLRVPYTQVGFHVDINHKKVYGPDFGSQPFDPGP